MSQLRLRQADGSFREILMIKGDKGDKGDAGNASESINDNINDNEHTWSSFKISTELATKINDADLVIDTVTVNDTISSLLHKVQIGKTKKFQYTNENGTTDLPSDYPQIMLNANCIFRPTITVNRITEGIMYLDVISANQSTGVPKILTGYYNGTFYWNNELSMTNVVNNLLTTTDGFVLDARQGKALKDNIDTINNNLQWVKSGNWEYQKLDNGTLRIKLRIDVVLDINTPTGSLFYCPSSPSNYPVAFIEPPTISVAFENTFGAWCTPYSLGTATSTPAFIFFLTVSILQLTGKFNLIAEGRWK